MNEKQEYFVVYTDCYPSAWKVTNKWNNDNTSCNFFLSEKLAQKEADRRNARNGKN